MSFFLSLGVSSRVFFSLSRGLLVEFWWCFGLPGPSNVRVFALGLSCESPRRPAGRRGDLTTEEHDPQQRT